MWKWIKSAQPRPALPQISQARGSGFAPILKVTEALSGTKLLGAMNITLYCLRLLSLGFPHLVGSSCFTAVTPCLAVVYSLDAV